MMAQFRPARRDAKRGGWRPAGKEKFERRILLI
jgi:hypothetical protein